MKRLLNMSSNDNICISGYIVFLFLVNVTLSDPKTEMGFQLMNPETLCCVRKNPNGPIYFNTWRESRRTQLAVSLSHIPKFTITTGVPKPSK